MQPPNSELEDGSFQHFTPFWQKTYASGLLLNLKTNSALNIAKTYWDTLKTKSIYVDGPAALNILPSLSPKLSTGSFTYVYISG